MAETDIDRKFRAWWNSNWRTLSEGQRKQALAYYNSRKQEEAVREQEKAQSKAETQGNLTAIAGAIGSPILYSAGNKIAGLLNLGQTGSTAGATGASSGSVLGDGIGSIFGGGSPAAQTASLPTSTLGTSAANTALSSSGSSLAPALGPAGDAAGVGLEAAPTSISNFAGAATPYLGAAGTALGAYSAYKGVKEKDPVAAGLGGAGIGAGLNMLGYALGPWGWAASLAVPAVMALANKIGDKDRFKDEWKRIDKLNKAGIQWGAGATEPERGREIDELVAIEQDKINRGGYGNTTFAQSRLEKDLKPLDTVGYSLHPELLGKAYVDADMEKRLQFNQELLNRNLIDEHHGTMDYTNKDAAKSLWDQVVQGMVQPAAAAPNTGMPGQSPAPSMVAPAPMEQPSWMPKTALGTAPEMAPPLTQGTPQLPTMGDRGINFGQENIPAPALGGIRPEDNYLWQIMQRNGLGR